MRKSKQYRYEKKRVLDTISINQLTNLGFYSLGHVPVKLINFRLDKKLADVKRWRFLYADSGATFFKLPNGAKVVVKPEVLAPFPPMKIGKRNSNREPRRMLTVMNELVKRGVEIEVPLGEIVAKNKHTLYITKAAKGITLANYLTSSPPQDGVLRIAKNMARVLANAHKKGVLHGHPHDKNWIINNNSARLIDAKGVSFKEEYPWKTIMGRVHTFETFANGEMHSTASWLPKYAQQTFLAEYSKRLGKSK